METTKVRKSKLLCHIHDKAKAHVIDVIRENVCVPNSEYQLTLFDGQYYCLFHLPTKDKDVKMFDQIFHKRIEHINKEISRLETQNVEQTLDKNLSNELQHDFRYVWFPVYVNFPIIITDSENQESETQMETQSFRGKVNFRNSTFSNTADFQNCTFHKDADFSYVNFSEYVQFANAEFCGESEFYNSIFSGYSGFSSTIFKNKARFFSAVFGEESQISFNETVFTSGLDLNSVKVEGYLVFERVNFSDKDLILDNIRITNPERVLFNSMTLHPSYFNVDSRMFVFNDIEWKEMEIDITKDKLSKEIENLREHNIQSPEDSLFKTLNQLADNAESNRRFDLAKLFRKQSIALQNKKCHIHFEVDSSKKDNIRQNVCRDYPVVNEDGGNYFCLLHNPDKNKAEIFLKEFETLKSNHSDFRAVVFPIAVEYNGNLPANLNLTGATFQRLLKFKKATIHHLEMSEAYFEEDSELVFEESTCHGKINLDKAVFAGKLFLKGNKYEFFTKTQNALSLKDVRFEKPTNANFSSIRLRPHYFVGVDTTKLNFHDCVWSDSVIDEELKCCSHKELAQTANQIAINYEETRQFEESSFFRYRAMETKRIEKKGWRRIINLHWVYKWTSGYGEHWSWAVLVLVGVLFYFGLFYATPLAKFDYGEKPQKKAESFAQKLCDLAIMRGNSAGMNGCDAAVHSLYVSALQRPEPKAADALTKLFVILQTILAPLQAALLALAIRRKFIR